ncbi:unnamed protein product [Cyberlindnera jadinii]|uniref:Ubiquitin-like domain-containing protein n=1 Tax=Cyberlindnera jadinii (strain ATCC 18201 / CBS 1600 / BCRC 20928 / JCM 3617 / NBRC 0987 / NRRL Y-1542) TaxID=983966 RepID=A0A0H5CAL4_CYBJN|nr:hypothetical protein CYBJADRAFT_160164 [Cyberlindnera jadinii NRRL Y-1542]ODV76176.1 hypothetical protein CYBJADRAFT_160164 [Cyberlindnera jadinii NRRL Y-1542]CEP20849.1 unnamed protein product [Cyberlindnera jadinii]
MSEADSTLDATEIPPDQEKIKIAVNGFEQRLYFGIRKGTKIKKVFQLFAKSVDLDYRTLIFTLDGRVLRETDTPTSIGLVDSDVILVKSNSDGGFAIATTL